MGTHLSISEIAILILFWCVGVIIMVILVKSFCKESKMESDSKLETKKPEKNK